MLFQLIVGRNYLLCCCEAIFTDQLNNHLKRCLLPVGVRVGNFF
nr:MAG TPA: hypothetical protein [Bacteriophage sp.]